jgi:hypothetical protein
MMMSQEFQSTSRQRKGRNIVHNPYMGADTYNNRCNKYCNIRGIYGEKVGWGFGSNLPKERVPLYSDT